MLKYARIWVNTCGYINEELVISCPFECVVTSFNQVHSVKEHEAVFLKTHNFILSIAARSI